MRRLCAVLMPLAFSGAFLFCGVSAWAESSNGMPFIIFDGLGYKNKPDLSKAGVSKIRIAYTAEIWDGATAREKPIEAAVKKLAQNADPNIPIVLDIEHWKVQGDSAEVDASISKLIQVVTWVHETNPSLKVGFFGLMPISDAWLELNYALAKNDPKSRNAAAFVKEYDEKFRESNRRMRKLAVYVDFVCPVLYTFYTLAGGAAKYQSGWDAAAANAIREATQYKKPIYAFVWPQFDEVKSENGDNEFIPASFWKHELELIRESAAQGVIIWGSPTFRRDGWNDNDSWWQVTKELTYR